MNFRNILLRFFILASFILSSRTVFTQNCLNEIYNNPIYSGADEIVNGTKWGYSKKYLGTPLLVEKYWPNADIIYNGKHYQGVLMNYDVYKNEIIIFYPEKDKEKWVVISIDKLSGFSFTDKVTNRKRFFEYIALTGNEDKALYENASAGNIRFFIKPVKLTHKVASEREEFINTFKYFLDNGNGYKKFHSKKQLLKLLGNHTRDLKKFIKKNNIKINTRQTEGVIATLEYFSGLQ